MGSREYLYLRFALGFSHKWPWMFFGQKCSWMFLVKNVHECFWVKNVHQWAINVHECLFLNFRKWIHALAQSRKGFIYGNFLLHRVAHKSWMFYGKFMAHWWTFLTKNVFFVKCRIRTPYLYVTRHVILEISPHSRTCLSPKNKSEKPLVEASRSNVFVF